MVDEPLQEQTTSEHLNNKENLNRGLQIVFKTPEPLRGEKRRRMRTKSLVTQLSGSKRTPRNNRTSLILRHLSPEEGFVHAVTNEPVCVCVYLSLEGLVANLTSTFKIRWSGLFVNSACCNLSHALTVHGKKNITTRCFGLQCVTRSVFFLQR